MYQVQQVIQLLNATKHLCLERDVQKLKHQHLQWSKINVLKNIMKFKLPSCIPLTPQMAPYPIQRVISDGGELWNASFFPHFDF
jgi:hypothetical protein